MAWVRRKWLVNNINGSIYSHFRVDVCVTMVWMGCGNDIFSATEHYQTTVSNYANNRMYLYTYVSRQK